MPYITFPDNGAFPGVYDREVYRGTAVSALKLGVVRKRLIDSVEDPQPIESYKDGQLIQEGHRFVCKVIPGATSVDPDTFGPWVAMRAQDQFGGSFNGRLVNKTDHEVKVAPGANMKDHDGFVIIPTVLQPASGEPARHSQTGELLVDEAGDPILEP